nr:uncharacterized protein LOC108005150 [Drosophila suzukii]
MSSSHSGTIGRKRVGSGSAASSEYYYASGGLAGLAGLPGLPGSGNGGGEQLRRQRSAEWHSHGRHTHGHGHGLSPGLGHGMGHGMGHGYGSSSEDEYQNTGPATAFDTQLLAQLLLQSQQLASMEHYNSDCEPEYLRQRDRHLEDTPLGDGPPPVAAAPEVTYAQPHQQRATMAGSPLKVSTVSAGKYQSNANLGLFPNSSSSGGSSVQNGVTTANTPRSTNPFLNNSSSKFPGEDGAANALENILKSSASSSTAASSNRSHRNTRNTLNRLSGMTSSSSDSQTHQQLQMAQQQQQQIAAVKQQHLLPPEDSGDDEFVLGLGSLDVGHCSSGGESEEPPPEPAPPEIPPRTQSLLMSLRKHSDYKLKYEEKGDQKHEEFIPTSQLQKDYIISDNLRSDQQLKPISPGDSNG